MASLAAKTSSPKCTWAQRHGVLWVTLEIADVDPEKAEITLTADKLTFKGESNGTMYALDCEFAKPVLPDDEKTVYAVNPRNVSFHIVKAEEDEEYWPFLMKDKALSKRLTSTDWSKWKDDDEEQEEFDTSGMGGMGGGMPGMGGPGMGGVSLGWKRGRGGRGDVVPVW